MLSQPLVDLWPLTSNSPYLYAFVICPCAIIPKHGVIMFKFLDNRMICLFVQSEYGGTGFEWHLCLVTAMGRSSVVEIPSWCSWSSDQSLMVDPLSCFLSLFLSLSFFLFFSVFFLFLFPFFSSLFLSLSSLLSLYPHFFFLSLYFSLPLFFYLS